MEQLIFLAVIVVISILHSWWKQRQEAKESMNDTEPVAGPQPRRRLSTPPGGQPASPPSKAVSWEQELRRLLGEEPEQRPPPPVIIQAPPPLPKAVPPRPVTARRATDFQESLQVETAAPARTPSLTQSAQAFLRGSHLELNVPTPVHPADRQVGQRLKQDLRKETSPEIRQAIGLLRNRQSQRAAIIAGIVLGQPKAMET
jgi:hypothetical protein